MPQAAIAVATWAASASLTIVGTTATGYAVAGAVSSAVLALGGAAGVGAFVGAWSLVASVGGALAGPPKIGSGDSGGSQIDFKADPNAGIPLVLGRTGTGGVIVHANTSGEVNKNSHLAFCAVLSAGPVQSIESLSANDELVSFTDELATNTKFAGAMWTRNQLGAKPSGPFPYPGVPAGWIPEWTDDHKLSGLAASWFVLHFDQEKYAGGAPKPTWVVNGVAVYDPRLDSTFPGGSGDCRADDEATWVFDGADNPFLQGLTFCVGRRANGVLTHGLGAPLEMIDVAAFVEGANVCEANGWTVGGVVSSADSKWEALKAMLQAGGGAPMKLGARISCLVNAPRVSLNASDPWTGADLVGEAQITATKSRRARINTIIPRYRSEAHQWQVVSNAPVVATTYVTEDDGSRTREVEYSLVQDPAQAAQLAAYDIVNSREIGPIVLPSKPRYVGYKPGDCITVNEPEIGLEDRKVLILGRTTDPASGVVTVVCQTETDPKHDFALGRTDVAPPTPGLSAGELGMTEPPGAGAFSLLGETLISDAQSIPAVVLEGASDNPNAAQLLVQYRVDGATDWISWPSVPLPGEGVAIRVEITGVTADTDYEVQVAYRSARGATSPWRNEGVATAGEWALAGLSAALSDGVLTPGEKLYVVPQIYALIDARAGLRANADAVNALEVNNLERLAYETAADDLDAVLATWTTPVAWDDSSDVTEIPAPATFIAAFRASITGERDLQNQVTLLWANKINEIDAAVIDMADDGVLTPAEKMLIIPQINAAIAARAQLRIAATALGLTYGVNAERTAFEDAASTLDSVLAAITSPVAWNNYTDKSVLPDAAAFRAAFEDHITRGLDLQSYIDREAGDRTTFVETDVGTLQDKTYYMDGSGRIFSHLALPQNALSGNAAYKTVWPFVPFENAMQINGFTDYRTGGDLFIPTASIFGLAAGTAYDFFYSYPHGTCIPVDLAFSYNYMVDPVNYIYIGRQSTQSAGGGTPPSPPAPPPGSGGGGSRSPYTVIP